ncbi:MAG: hypothetical protein JW795_13250 [Chitinivibrionales bacterium]|nr:hypothetical protein [Chitinivibrionales bacterium]
MDIDDREETVGRKIADANRRWLPYVAVASNAEAASDTLSLTKRSSGRRQSVDRSAIESLIRKETEGFPAEIGRLDKMEELSCRKNIVAELPKEIGDLANLRILELDMNALGELPSEIGKLKKLQKLSLMENTLTGLPQQIGGCTSLEYLNLLTNRILHIPKEIGNCSKINSLSLRKNRLTTLPESICSLTTLTINLLPASIS